MKIRITSTASAVLPMAFLNRHGIPVAIGDKVTDSRGKTATVTGWQEPRHSGSSGRIYVKFNNGGTGEFYPNVYGCGFFDTEGDA